MFQYSETPPLQSSIHAINASSPIMAEQFILSRTWRENRQPQDHQCARVPLMFQLLIFTMNARGDEETANFNCSQKSVKRDNHVSLITREEGRLLFPFPDLLEIEYDYSLARWNNLTIRAVNFYRVAFCFLAIKRVWNLSNRRGDYDVINLRQIIFTGVEMYESCCDL